MEPLDLEAIKAKVEETNQAFLRGRVEPYWEPERYDLYDAGCVELAKHVPALLTEVEKLRAENERLQRKVRCCFAGVGSACPIHER